eukprot:CAMPEP_0181138922 /NCGR_PEP_ID=MMETSP1071-20121207/34509_1 /TAXON_ID=35127 /ORGANISM="Thalassiosira sp., Strain NH16" /LENGTH=82 /DNA_ID=CAMNT_0023225799 /DNA_START=428 /DNA_END=672 /DNA_ORIENTATION=+
MADPPRGRPTDDDGAAAAPVHDDVDEKLMDSFDLGGADEMKAIMATLTNANNGLANCCPPDIVVAGLEFKPAAASSSGGPPT